jgi:probable HAF family extracellular repeat protein
MLLAALLLFQAMPVYQLSDQGLIQPSTPPAIATPPQTLGGAATAWGISPDGTDVVGDCFLADGVTDHAVLFMGGVIYDLGTLGGAVAQAWGVNDSHLVVGSSLTASGLQHAFAWTASTGMVDLTPNALDAVAESVDETGVVYGYMDLGAGACGFVTVNGAAVDINTLTPNASPFHIYECFVNATGGIQGHASGPGPVGATDHLVGLRLISPAPPSLHAGSK